MSFRALLITFAFLLFPTQVCADWDMDALFELLSTTTFHDSEQGGFTGIKLEGSIVYEDWQRPWTVVLEPKLRLDSQDYARGARDLSDQRRSVFSWREAYLGYSKSPFRVRLGFQVIRWGVVQNSLADLCAHDFTRIPARGCRSSPILDIRYGGDTFVEGFLTPYFTASFLPRGKWLAVSENVRLLDARDEANQLQGGVRLGTVLGITSLQLVFYDGYANNPYGKVLGITSRGHVVVEPRFSEVDLISASLVRDLPFGGLHAKVEISYLEQKEGDDFLQYTAGVEKLFPQVFTKWDQLFVALQYTFEDITETETDPKVVQFLSDLRRSFEGALLAKTVYRLNPHWNFSLRSTYNLSEEDYFFEPAVEWTPSGGHLKITVGYQSVGGPRNTFWGQYRENDSLFFRFTWRF